MPSRRIALIIPLAFALALTAGCRSEPTPPQVVGTTPPVEVPEPTPEPEPTPTPLAEISISLEPVVTDLDMPLFVTGAGDGSGRLFVVEKSGRIWIMRDGRRAAAPFLDIADKISEGGEQGLLGLAFPPDFADSRVCYVNYTDRSGGTVVSRLRVDGDAALPASEDVLLTVPQPYANHNGGMIAFGPDGYLYIGLGDGGSGGDPQGNGQNLDTLLGKMLRIDVWPGASSRGYAIPDDNPFVGRTGARPEIWAYGLRNPWRFSFDRKTGDLWIGDVGQSAWEEIDFQPASSAGGENYGWNVYEGAHTYPPGTAPPPDPGAFTMPVVEYDRQAGKSVNGGYVYRGSGQTALWGTYFYADYVDGRIWGLQRTVHGAVQTQLLADTDALISSFGQDDDGELYLTDLNGGLFRMVTQ